MQLTAGIRFPSGGKQVKMQKMSGFLFCFLMYKNNSSFLEDVLYYIRKTYNHFINFLRSLKCHCFLSCMTVWRSTSSVGENEHHVQEHQLLSPILMICVALMCSWVRVCFYLPGSLSLVWQLERAAGRLALALQPRVKVTDVEGSSPSDMVSKTQGSCSFTKLSTNEQSRLLEDRRFLAWIEKKAESTEVIWEKSNRKISLGYMSEECITI